MKKFRSKIQSYRGGPIFSKGQSENTIIYALSSFGELFDACFIYGWLVNAEDGVETV